ncbi:MAG: Gfo/Idh/MocA family protein [Anaerolineaceae bacterium]
MKQKKVYGIGVIGLGVFGARHAEVCAKHPGFELLGVSDLQPETLRNCSEKLNVPGFLDYREMLDLPGLDAVTIATSDQFHVEPCYHAAQKGLDIFLEKPIADTSENARKIIQHTRTYNVKLMVGHTLRYDPRYLAVKQAQTDGNLGELIHVYARRNATVASGRRLKGRVDAMIFQGVHDLDYLEWLVGSKIEKVYAESTSKILNDLNVNDTTMSTLRFENGVIGLLEQSWALPAGMPSALDVELEVVGTQGSAYLDLRSQSISFFHGGRLTQPDLIYGLPDQHFLIEEYNHFEKHLSGLEDARISGEEALRALIVAEAIMESAKLGQPVYIS